MTTKPQKNIKPHDMIRGDAYTISKAKNCSQSFVRMVINGNRKDTKGVMQMLFKLISYRNRLIQENLKNIN